MTVVQHSSTTPPDPWAGRDDLPVSDGVEIRAHCRRQATVLVISGRVDATTIDRVSSHAARCAMVGNAVILDLSGVWFCSAHTMALLYAVDEACGRAEVNWVLVPSGAVEQALRAAACADLVPTAKSVPGAMQYVAHLARVRLQVLQHSPDRGAPGMAADTSGGGR